MEVKIDNKWYEVDSVVVDIPTSERHTEPRRLRIPYVMVQDVKLNGKQLFDNDIKVQHQTWYKQNRYILTTEGASVQLVANEEPQGDDKITAYIFQLWVDEDKRRQGKASALMNRAEKLAKELGYKEVFLDWSRKEAERSTLEWYERRGYDMASFGTQSMLLKKKL